MRSHHSTKVGLTRREGYFVLIWHKCRSIIHIVNAYFIDNFFSAFLDAIPGFSGLLERKGVMNKPLTEQASVTISDCVAGKARIPILSTNFGR